jgi:hypothetical protein
LGQEIEISADGEALSQQSPRSVDEWAFAPFQWEKENRDRSEEIIGESAIDAV